MNIMFNMVLKFAHYLCNRSDFGDFGNFEDLGKTADFKHKYSSYV